MKFKFKFYLNHSLVYSKIDALIFTASFGGESGVYSPYHPFAYKDFNTKLAERKKLDFQTS